jgi:hypothetical protein
MYNYSVRTSQETLRPVAKSNRLMLFREIISVYCENRMRDINTLCGQNSNYFNVKVNGTYSYAVV